MAEEEKQSKVDWEWYENSEIADKIDNIHEDSAKLESFVNRNTGSLEITNGASGWIRSDAFIMDLQENCR